ncbi:MFS transporter [Paenibacillus sp. MMS18-CY102]|uniref:MFS transporter n=1 Tax=Paenibacillus sp. MMS18-CY102 TaxID=2682849 RepID=UPI00136571E0|nr:MFS transporter [Paenibacillus sp. MMS18-CY102]MWC31309.1 MFS transporter [Paenibacillus sp. MMS18-CY102]
MEHPIQLKRWFKEPRYAWFILLFFWIFGFVGSIGRFVLAYYQSDITETLNMGRSFLGVTWSVSILIGALSAPLGGWLVDRYGYKLVIIFSSLLGTLSSTIILLATNPIGYFLGFGICSGLAGIGATTGYVIISDWFNHHRAKALMILGSAGSLGLAILTPVFVSNKSWLNWTGAYWILFVIGVVFIPLTLLFVRERKQTAEETEAQADAARKDETVQAGFADKMRILFGYLNNRVIMAVALSLFTCGFGMGTVEMHLMAIHQHAHVNVALFTASLSLLGVLELAGGFVFSYLMDRLNRAAALSALFIMRVAAFVILFMHWDATPLLFSLIFGASYLGAIPGGILLASESLKSNQKFGLQSGVLLMVHQLGGVLAGIAGGANYDLLHNYQLLIGINVALSTITAIAYFLIYRYQISSNRRHPTAEVQSV